MLKVLELFAGIGACSKALERLGIEHEIVDAVEIDKYAVKSFNAIHNTSFEPQDIMTWNKDLEVDLIFHGSPCQDFSLAGNQAGGDKDSGTRSSLMYETIRIVEKLKPKYVIWENVKNVISKKHRHNFDNYLQEMERLGYTNYWQVLNAKDYGIPQNRERVFTISIYNEPQIQVLGNYSPSNHDASRIVDINGIAPTIKENHGTITGIATKCFTFPLKQELKLRLKDMLEDEVDEKYYLSELQSFVLKKYKSFGSIPDMFNPYNECEVKNVAPTQTIGCGSTTSSATILIKNATKQGYLEATNGDGCYINNIDKKRGTVQKEMIPTIKTSLDVGVVVKNQGKVIEKETDIATTLMARDYKGFGNQNMTGVLNNLRIRKLTPKECWRLMGFDDEDFDKASLVNSNSQLYKQAGNSIVVNVLEAIFKELFKGDD